MTGRKVAEYTNATTTQFLDATSRRWATGLLEQLGLPTRLLPPIVEPGRVLEPLLPALRDAVGLRHEVPGPGAVRAGDRSAHSAPRCGFNRPQFWLSGCHPLPFLIYWIYPQKCPFAISGEPSVVRLPCRYLRQTAGSARRAPQPPDSLRQMPQLRRQPS
jgi:FGGY family of carbohydrate kinases, N-terminal domain